MKTHFETETCSRCHGSGSYSYCADYGDKCFKCAGSGKTLSKRGAAAKAYLEKLCTIPAKEVKLGDRVAATGITNRMQVYSYIGTVTAIKSRKAIKTTVRAKRQDSDRIDVSYKVEYTETEGFSVLGSSGATSEFPGSSGYGSGEVGTIVEEFTEYTFSINSKYGDANQTLSDNDNVRVYANDNADKIAKALEYQATLTKQGKERKTRTMSKD